MAGLFFEEALLPQGWARGVSADEPRQLEYLQRLAHRARNVVASTNTPTDRTPFEGALKGGSQALGVETSGLIEGGFADIVSLDAGNVALAGRSGDAILDSWIFGAGRHHAREAIALRFGQALQGLLTA